MMPAPSTLLFGTSLRACILLAAYLASVITAHLAEVAVRTLVFLYAVRFFFRNVNLSLATGDVDKRHGTPRKKSHHLSTKLYPINLLFKSGASKFSALPLDASGQFDRKKKLLRGSA